MAGVWQPRGFQNPHNQVLNLPDQQSLLGHAAPSLCDPHLYAGQSANHIVQAIGVQLDPLTHQPTHVIVNVTTSGKYVYINGDSQGSYNGNSFYWSNGNVAGTFDCTNHCAYNANRCNLGYARNWSAAAILIYRQGS